MSEAEDFVFFTKHSQYGVWGRIATNVLNTIANDFTAQVNHEVNGHGFRLRSLGEPVLGYSFTILGGAETRHWSLAGKPVDKGLLVTIGG